MLFSGEASPLGVPPKAPCTCIELGENLAIRCIKVHRFCGALGQFKPVWFLSGGLSFPECSLSPTDPSGLRLCRQLPLKLSLEEERVVCSHAVESLFCCPWQLELTQCFLSFPTGDPHSPARFR